MLAVGQIQYPKHGHVVGGRILAAAEAGIQASPAELRFAFRNRVQVGGILLEDVEYGGNDPPGLGQMLGPYEVEVVRGCVILGEHAELPALQEPNRKIESRRAILALIISVGREVQNGRMT